MFLFISHRKDNVFINTPLSPKSVKMTFWMQNHTKVDIVSVFFVSSHRVIP